MLQFQDLTPDKREALVSRELIRIVLEASWRVVRRRRLVAAVLFTVRARSSSVRHAAWSAVLVAMMAMPVLPHWCRPSKSRRQRALFRRCPR